MKILFFTNIPSPYRVDFFNELSTMCDLFVLFEAKVDLECPRNFAPKEQIQFKHHFLSESKSYNNLILSGLWFVLTSKYDRLILHTWYTRTQICLIVILRLLNKKYWIETDGNFMDSNESFLKKRFKRWLLCGAEGIFSPSKQSDDYFISYRIDKEKIHRYTFTSIRDNDVLTKPIDPFEKIEIRNKIGIEKGKKMVLAVGRFIPRKGFDVLIKACTADRNTVFVGGEPTQEYLHLIKELKLEEYVLFIKHCSKIELSDYYKAADLFVLPTRYDIWGLVINEAMSYGLPVITTEWCGAGLEVLDNQDITIVPSDDVESLKISISKLLNNEELRGKIGVRNLNYAREHTIEKMAIEHILI